MQVELSIMDLHKVENALVRDYHYWRKTRRKDLRASERAVTMVGIQRTLEKVRAAIEATPTEPKPDVQHTHMSVEEVTACKTCTPMTVAEPEDDSDFARHLEEANAEASGSVIVQQVQEGHR